MSHLAAPLEAPKASGLPTSGPALITQSAGVGHISVGWSHYVAAHVQVPSLCLPHSLLLLHVAGRAHDASPWQRRWAHQGHASLPTWISALTALSSVIAGAAGGVHRAALARAGSDALEHVRRARGGGGGPARGLWRGVQRACVGAGARVCARGQRCRGPRQRCAVRRHWLHCIQCCPSLSDVMPEGGLLCLCAEEGN